MISSTYENPYGFIGGRDRKEEGRIQKKRKINKVRKKTRMMGKVELKKNKDK